MCIYQLLFPAYKTFYACDSLFSKGYKIPIDPIWCYRTVTYWQPTNMLQCAWCSTQNQSALPFVGFLRRSISSFKKKTKELISRTKEIEKDDKFIVRCTGFGDVEVLSDLFLRERLHVPHRLDVVRRKLAMYSASPNISPRVRVPAKINTRC